MRVVDLMTTDVITTTTDTGLKDAARVLIQAGVSGLPVVDGDGRLVGIITEADFVEAEADRAWGREKRRLLDALFGERQPRQATTVGEAMTRHPVVIDMESDVTEAARKMIEHGVKRLPVVNPDGRLEGIISRADILRAFARPDEVIADEVRNDVLRRILMLDPEEFEVEVADGVVRIGGHVVDRSDVQLIEALIGRLEGVVRVESSITWEVDDTRM